MVVKIKLGISGKFCLVDESDFESVNSYSWSFDGKYACRSEHFYKDCGKRTSKKVYMHRYILGATKGVYVDHINGDGLDNTRCNIRICTQSENNANRKKGKGTSKYKGVSWSKKEKKWIAYVKENGRTIRLGRSECEESCAKMYNNFMEERYGEYFLANNVE